MASDTGFLSSEVTDRLTEVSGTEILVGIPSYNNADTIAHVVRSVQAGLAKYFPRVKAIIVNSDGGSEDGTRDVVESTTMGDPRALMVSHDVIAPLKIITPYQGIPGKGSAFRTIFAIAELSGAKACAVVDSDLKSITPEWIELLVRPVYEGTCDYVAPLYKRHKFDGTITNSIVYPLTRALYGKKVRQPIGGDFGFSGKLASDYLARDVWGTDIARFGIDIWMTTTAIANGYRICQSFLGAKIHAPKDPGADLSAMLYQVMSALFGLMEEYSGVWSTVNGNDDVPTLGFQYEVGLEPVNVNLERMLEKFRNNVKEMEPVWRDFLSDDVMALVKELSLSPMEGFGFQDELWARALYDFSLAYHNRVLNRELLLKSLTPLYMGKVASLVMEMADSGVEEVERRIEGICRAFKLEKLNLIKKWQGLPQSEVQP